MELRVVTPEQVENLLCSALEGGSNYWYFLPDLKALKESTPEMEGSPLVSRIFEFVWNKGGSVPVSDYYEDDRSILGHITKESLIKAETLLIEEYPKTFADVVAENDDAETGDVFFQLAVMGELTFG